MPTGYTTMIDDNPNLTTAKWVTEGLSRAFGVCVILRDHSMNLTEAQIEEYLEKEVERGTKYYRENLAKTQETLKSINSNPEETWNDLYQSTVDRMKEYNKRSEREANKTRLRHQQIIIDLVRLRDNTTDEVTRSIAQFGLDQLKLVESDTTPYLQEIPSFEKFKADKIHKLNRDIVYYQDEIEKAKKREQSRLETYQKIISETNRILGGEIQSSAPTTNEVEE